MPDGIHLLPRQTRHLNPSLVRTDDKARDKQIRLLFSQLIEANEKNQIEEQNKLFREMESLSPRHETVFQARSMFFQDDEDWPAEHDVLKECVAAIPDSVYCLRRLSNTRSSTTDEKLRYGGESPHSGRQTDYQSLKRLYRCDLGFALHQLNLELNQIQTHG